MKLTTVIYAGLDVDGFVKLFLELDNGVITKIDQQGWTDILSDLFPRNELEAGEMPVVILVKDNRNAEDKREINYLRSL